MKKTIVDEIIDKIREFTQKNGRRPARIIIPIKREDEFLAVTADRVGDVAGKILVEGPRNAIQKIYGIQVVWSDEDTLHVL